MAEQENNSAAVAVATAKSNKRQFWNKNGELIDPELNEYYQSERRQALGQEPSRHKARTSAFVDEGQADARVNAENLVHGADRAQFVQENDPSMTRNALTSPRERETTFDIPNALAADQDPTEAKFDPVKEPEQYDLQREAAAANIQAAKMQAASDESDSGVRNATTEDPQANDAVLNPPPMRTIAEELSAKEETTPPPDNSEEADGNEPPPPPPTGDPTPIETDPTQNPPPLEIPTKDDNPNAEPSDPNPNPAPPVADELSRFVNNTIATENPHDPPIATASDVANAEPETATLPTDAASQPPPVDAQSVPSPMQSDQPPRRPGRPRNS